MASNFSQLTGDIIQIAVKCLRVKPSVIEKLLGLLLDAVLHCLTLTHPDILYSCGIQYMSCSFHCISGKDFFLLKKK